MIGILCASGTKAFCLSYASGSQISSWVGQFVNLFDVGLTALLCDWFAPSFG